MRSSYLSFLFVLAAVFTFAQEVNPDAVSLAKQLCKTELEKRLNNLNETAQFEDDTKSKSDTDLSALYKELSKAYSQNFSSNEIKQLLTFYKSPLGKKLNKTKSKLDSEVSQMISKWEMKQLGIENEELIDIAEDDMAISGDDMPITDAKLDKTIPKEKEYPEIKTLSDLKAIVLKEPFLINDTRLLTAVLGPDVDIDKLLFPDLEINEDINRE